jgi:hypothetical protein
MSKATAVAPAPIDRQKLVDALNATAIDLGQADEIITRAILRLQGMDHITESSIDRDELTIRAVLSGHINMAHITVTASQQRVITMLLQVINSTIPVNPMQFEQPV